MFNLGVSYLQGRGVPLHEGKAAKWVKRAIDGGVDSEGHAEKVYGMLCHLGQGVPQSNAIAKHYLQRGVAKGSAECAEYIRQMDAGTITTDSVAIRSRWREGGITGFGPPESEDERRGAEEEEEGQLGPGFPSDQEGPSVEDVEEMRREAAKGANPMAMYFYGVLQFTGRSGVALDVVAGAALIQAAAKAGHQPAAQFLRDIHGSDPRQ